jgi:hypothetical protein
LEEEEEEEGGQSRVGSEAMLAPALSRVFPPFMSHRVRGAGTQAMALDSMGVKPFEAEEPEVVDMAVAAAEGEWGRTGGGEAALHPTVMRFKAGWITIGRPLPSSPLPPCCCCPCLLLLLLLSTGREYPERMASTSALERAVEVEGVLLCLAFTLEAAAAAEALQSMAWRYW